jgi:hypothetical protein
MKKYQDLIQIEYLTYQIYQIFQKKQRQYEYKIKM